MSVRVLLCEDHAMVREGLARLLGSAPGIEVVGTAADGEEGVALAERLRPDVVMMDLSMPGALPSRRARPSRTIAWSSQRRTRTVIRVKNLPRALSGIVQGISTRP